MFSVTRFFYSTCDDAPPRIGGGGIGSPLLRGPAGPPGPPGGTSIANYTAGMALSSGRAVVKDDDGKIYYYNPANNDHAGRIIGITTASAIQNATVPVQYGGKMQDDGFTFTTNQRVYVTTNGQLTTTLPTSGNVQLAGVSLSANSLQINFTIPLLRTF